MTLAATIASGRRMAAAMFIDTGTVTRAGVAVFDPNTGLMTPGSGTVIYDGPCRVRMPNAVETTVLFGERLTTQARFIGLFPWDVPNIELGDVVAVTESDDPYIGDRQFRVTFVASSSVLTHRRAALEVVE